MNGVMSSRFGQARELHVKGEGATPAPALVPTPHICDGDDDLRLRLDAASESLHPRRQKT